MGFRVVVLAALVLGALTACGLVPAPTQNSGLACNEPPEGNWRAGGREIPDVAGRRPSEAAAAFAEADIAVSWRYNYATDLNNSNIGYAECWCEVPPDDGVVQDVTVGDGWLIVHVERREGIAGGREQPRLGWGCEPDPSGESSPSAAREPQATLRG
jgi:hypothetical protein